MFFDKMEENMNWSERTVSDEIAVEKSTVNEIFVNYIDDKFYVNRRYQRKLVWEIDEKRLLIDSMLKKLLETLKCVKTDYLKIEVKKDYNTIGLIINNINVFEMDFKYEFSKKDIYYIENVIFELVQDFYDFDLSKVDIIVCE